MTPDFLTLPDRRLAYQQLRGRKDAAGLVFLGGFASDMTGTKASYLAERCAAAGLPFLRFDYSGHGQSGGSFRQGTIGGWFQDVLAAVDRLSEGPQLVIGSSMGGWLGLMLARDKPERVKAFVGIAAAPDFTEDLIWEKLSPAEREKLAREGEMRDPTAPPDHDAPITFRLVEEARRHLLLRGPLAVACPIRLLQGKADTEVPWRHALRIKEAIGDNAAVAFVEGGDHRLSRPQDLELLWETVAPLAG